MVEALERGFVFLERDWHRKVVFKTADDLAVVDLSTLEAVVSDDHQQLFCLADGRQLEVRARISEVKERLSDVSPFVFLSPCRGILVNSEAVLQLTPAQVVLRSGRTLPVAKRKYTEFKEALTHVKSLLL